MIDFVRLAACVIVLLFSTITLMAEDDPASDDTAITDTATKDTPAIEPTPALTADELAAKVRYLVRNLDGDTLKEREEAEKQLVELGPQVIDHLPKISNRTSAEMKARLERLRTVLEKKAIDQLTEATHITLSVKEAPLSEVLKEIEKQTGNKFFDFRDNFGQQGSDPKISLDVTDGLFWEVADQVFDDAGVMAYHFSGRKNVLAYLARPENNAPAKERVSYAEVFRFEPTRIEAGRNLQAADGGNMILYLQVAWEPRISPVVIKMPLSELSVTDDQGNELLGQNTGSLDTEVNGSSVDLTIGLNAAKRSAIQIDKISGTIEALVPGGIETFEFDKLQVARNVEQTRGGMKVVLEGFFKNADLYQARVLLKFEDASEAFESHRGWVFSNEVYLLGADGEKVEVAGYEQYQGDIDSIGISYQFVLEQEVANYKLVYKTPASMVTLPVKFELKDIPLP
ncbi:MAG: hypothetical protein COA78_38140 [Blastopirellula sp.]|nr:MAG: hypothetical protein COA78_38140 [Blastopirellula sp.]